MKKFSIKYGTICAALLLFSTVNGSDVKTVKLEARRKLMPEGFQMPPRREQTPVSAFYRYPVALESFLKKLVRGTNTANADINVSNNFNF